jgi:hypothetical protein
MARLFSVNVLIGGHNERPGDWVCDVREAESVSELGIERISTQGYWHHRDDLLGGEWYPPSHVRMVQVLPHVPGQGGK